MGVPKSNMIISKKQSGARKGRIRIKKKIRINQNTKNNRIMKKLIQSKK
jgi:hypothetical protein